MGTRRYSILGLEFFSRPPPAFSRKYPSRAHALPRDPLRTCNASHIRNPGRGHFFPKNPAGSFAALPIPRPPVNPFSSVPSDCTFEKMLRSRTCFLSWIIFLLSKYFGAFHYADFPSRCQDNRRLRMQTAVSFLKPAGSIRIAHGDLQNSSVSGGYEAAPFHSWRGAPRR